MSSHVSALLLVLVASVCVAGDQTVSEAPKSDAGLAAIQKFDLAVTKADTARNAAIASALRDEIAELEKARKVAMKADDLDEATRCSAAKKAAQDRLDKDTASPGPIGPRIGGTSWKMPANGATIYYNDNGSLTCDKWPAGLTESWKSIDANTIVQYEPTGDSIRTTFTSDKKFALYEYLTGSHTGEANYIVLINPKPAD